MKETVNVRLGKAHVDRVRSAAAKHTLKPTLRAAIERGTELVIKEMEEEKKND
jgi:hypothetical protein